MIKAFFDMEFTGLHQNTTPISLGIVYDNGNEFYAEFTDYDIAQVDKWLRENVISKLILENMQEQTFKLEKKYGNTGTLSRKMIVRGTTNYISKYLDFFHKSIGATKENKIKFYSDCLAYDWVLLNQLWNGALQIPNNIYYIPIDISSYFDMINIDPDINREEFASNIYDNDKHNSLHDAKVIKECYYKMVELGYIK